MEALRVDTTDRRRILLASALTLVALPLVLNENRKQEGEPPLAVVSPDAGLASQLQPGASSPAPAAAASTQAPVATAVAPTLPEITGPVTATAAPPTLPEITGPVSTQVPTPPVNVLQGDGTWDRWSPAAVGTTTPCATALAEPGRQVTVTNLDNGRSVTCVVVDNSPLPTGVVVKLDAALFQSLADLGESPIPVRLTL